MRKLPLLAAALLALAVSTPALAEVKVRINLGLPVILPPLVEVEPGLRVVQDYDEEIFFIGGYYWVQRDARWYRTRDHRGTWRYVGNAAVPPALVRQQPGHYRRWQHDERRAWPEPRGRPAARHWRPGDARERPQPGNKGGERERGGNEHGERERGH